MPATDNARTIYADAYKSSPGSLTMGWHEAGLAAVVAAAKSEALVEAAREFQQQAVDQLGLFGFARVSLDLLHARAADIRKEAAK